MAILADTLKTLLTKAGFDLESDDYKKLIQAKELVIEIPESVSTSLTSLLSETEAKHHPKIKSHIKAEALDPFNNKIEVWLKEHGADEETIRTMKEDANTYAKVENVIKKIAELKSKPGDSKGEKAELERKVNDLSKQLSEVVVKAETEREQAIAELTNRYESEFTEMEIGRQIASQPLPGQFGFEVESKIAREFINKKMNDLGAAVKKVDGNFKIVAKDDEKRFIFVNGKEIDLPTLTSLALADNKFLKVSGNGGGEPPKPTPQGQPTPLKPAQTRAISHIDEMLNGQ
jgi:vacuolar-type H+-ATPase subunit I/STV1